MATYSYDIKTVVPLTPQQQADIRSGGSVPDSARQAAATAETALANSTFGQSYTPGFSIGSVSDGNFVKQTQITSPAEIAAAALPPGIAPVEGAANRLVETRAPVANAPQSSIVEQPPIPQELKTVVNVDITTPPPPPPPPPTEAPPPVPAAPVPTAPVAFEPLTVGGRILAPSEFAGAADRLVVNPPPNTNPAPVVTGGGGSIGAGTPGVDPNGTGNTGGEGNPGDVDPPFVAEQPPTAAPAAVFVPPGPETEPNPPPPEVTQPGVSTAAATNRAQGQSTDQTRVNQPAAADWRVRISLAQNSSYLYNAPSNRDGTGGPGILAPLRPTNGVIFPYTPSIETSYVASYAKTDLIHSNYKGQFYQSSSVSDIIIRGTFTAQDTREASYLLAVIHFFRSVTKMFYGQDPQAGTPPPLVYLSGFGQYQFNNHPCVVTNFTYNLPSDVDYIRANGFNNIGLNMSNRKNPSSGPPPSGSLGTVLAIIGRLTTSGLKPGAVTKVPNSSTVNQNVANQNSINSTYVPTKMEISVTLSPIQTRSQVSQQFSLENFANGDLLKGGFW